MKHPLWCRWSIWYDGPAKKTTLKNWSDNLKEVYTFDTVEVCCRHSVLPFACVSHASSSKSTARPTPPLYKTVGTHTLAYLLLAVSIRFQAPNAILVSSFLNLYEYLRFWRIDFICFFPYRISGVCTTIYNPRVSCLLGLIITCSSTESSRCGSMRRTAAVVSG